MSSAPGAPAGTSEGSRSAEHRELQNPREGEGDYRFLCTGNTGAFEQAGPRFLQMSLGPVEHIGLAKVDVTV